jgi:hypothetical protein
MAGELSQFFVRLGTIFDDKGFKDAAAGVKGLESKVDDLSKTFRQLAGLVGAGSAIYGIVSFSRAALDAFSKQELASRKLETAMRNLGVFSRAALEEQLAFASALQASTKYGDETITETQALLTTFGLYGDQLKTTTKAALDLASGLGIDLRSSALLLGKAAVGETSTLSRYGIVIDDGIPKAQRFAEALRQINERFGGAAAAEAETYSGRIAQLANRFDDLKERIGKLLLGPANGVIKWMNDAATVAEWLGSKFEQAFPTDKVAKLEKELATTERQLAGMKKQTDIVGEAINWAMGTSTQEQVVSLENKIALLRLQLQRAREEAAAGAPAAAAGASGVGPGSGTGDNAAALELMKLQAQEDAKYQIKVAAAQQWLETSRLTSQDEQNFKAMEYSNLLAMEGKFQQSRQVLEAQAAKNRQKSQVSMMSDWAAALSNLTALSNAKTKEVAMIGKIASAAMAIIYGLMGASLAMATIPPPWGLAMAALIKAAGFANAAMIMGVPLAKGGIVRAAMGGTLAQVGEAGQDEAVLPLDGSTMRRLALAISGAGGGMVMAGGAGASVHFTQVNHFGSMGGQGGPGLSSLLNDIREATRDGMAEALDMAKQITRTGDALSNEA